MPSTPPGRSSLFPAPGPMPRLPSPSASRNRSSIGSSLSFAPQNLLLSYLEGNSSTMSTNSVNPNYSIITTSPHPSPRKHKRGKSSIGKHPLASDTTDVFQDTDDEGEGETPQEWGMVDRMRLWRHDSLMQHLYETAAFWGDKILSWTNEPNDAFWLAQIYFMSCQYSRAERLLIRPFPANTPNMPRGSSTSANGQPSQTTSKGKGRDYDASQLMLSMPRLPTGPAGMIDVPEELQDKVTRLIDVSVACRYLAGLCQLRQGKWSEALELLGESNPFESGSGGPTPNVDGGIKVEASMCHLRGLLMLKLNRTATAKQNFMEALSLDVKCYESLEQLISGAMMNPDEEWEFVQGLAYAAQTPEDAEFIQLMYTTRLRKFKHVAEHELTRQRLINEYNLGDNIDVLYSYADTLYSNSRWADCHVITERILGLVSVHNEAMVLHIGCMYHLSDLHSKLFILAHHLVESEPENPISWYAVGIWYLGKRRWSSARQFLSKASLMDPLFSAAWIAFGHAFAFEAEHDHSVTAYSTAGRLFPGSHFPMLFAGMQYITLSNYAMADECLEAANTMCEGDPLVTSELGVMAYNHGEYEKAALLFQRALDFADFTHSPQKAWVTTFLNLGTCYRKLRRFDDARQAYQKVLELDFRNSLAFAFLGMVYHFTGQLDKAITKYHEALSIEPINPSVVELLNIALESAVVPFPTPEAIESEFRTAVQALKVKYSRHMKGKEKALGGDIRVDSMNIG